MKTLIVTTVLAAIALPAAAQTGGPDIVRVTVRFSDLDLAQQADANLMISRLRRAARIVCGVPPDLRELDASERYRFCVARATKAAVTELNAPLVTAAYSRSYPARLLANR